MKITDEQIGAAGGTVVAVDGGVLLAYVKASRELRDLLTDNTGRWGPIECEQALLRWEIAHATLCGNLTGL